MKKYTQSNGKIIRSMVDSMMRLVKEVFDDLLTDADVKGVFWSDDNSERHAKAIYYNGLRIVMLQKVPTKTSETGHVIMVGLWKDGTKKDYNVREAEMIEMGDLPFDVQAKLAVFLTNVFQTV